MTARTSSPEAAGSLVMTPERTARPVRPRVVHQLARVKPAPAALPYVMACGTVAGSIEQPTDEAKRCGRCWKDGA